MGTRVTEDEEESLRKQCEVASLEDIGDSTRKVGGKAQLPPIQLGMSFSDWKQMKESAQDNTKVNSAKIWKPPAQLKQQKQNFNKPFFESHQQDNYYNNNNNNQTFKNQLQNFPNFNTLNPPRHNQQGRRNFFQEQSRPHSKIPPLIPPQSFDEFPNDDQQWSTGGPLMQPMFPPMPRISRSFQQGQLNNRFLGQKRPSARTKPKSGQTGFKAMSKPQKKESPKQRTRTNETDGATTTVEIRTEPQVYVYRPRNTNRPDKVKTNWIVMPKAPPPMNANTPESREEKARLWREYRQAMKPFKHREFANAKRVIQRLSKKSYDELDEKDRERLDKATEFVNSHKAMLTERMLQRSARVEQELKPGKPNLNVGSTGNGQNSSSNNWVANNESKNQPSSNNGNAQHIACSQSQTSLAKSFVSGGFWQLANAVPKPKS